MSIYTISFTNEAGKSHALTAKLADFYICTLGTKGLSQPEEVGAVQKSPLDAKKFRDQFWPAWCTYLNQNFAQGTGRPPVYVCERRARRKMFGFFPRSVGYVIVSARVRSRIKTCHSRRTFDSAVAPFKRTCSCMHLSSCLFMSIFLSLSLSLSLSSLSLSLSLSPSFSLSLSLSLSVRLWWSCQFSWRGRQFNAHAPRYLCLYTFPLGRRTNRHTCPHTQTHTRRKTHTRTTCTHASNTGKGSCRVNVFPE